MNKFRKNIDEYFREKIGRPAETPPADVWADLEKRLDGLHTVPTSPNRWLWHFAIVSLIVLLSIPFLRKMTGASVPDVANTALAEQTNANTQAKGTGNNHASTANNTATTNNIIPADKPANTKPVAATNNVQDAILTPGIKTANAAVVATAQGKHNTGVNYQPVQHNALAAKTANGTGRAKTDSYHKAINASGAKESEYNANLYNSGTGIITPAIAAANENSKSAAQQPAGINDGKGNSNETNTGEELNKKDIKESGKKPATPQQEEKPIIASIPYHSRIEAGIKGGYEAGLNPNAATKYVVAPYIQYSLSEKFAVVAQPGFKYGTISNRSVGAARSYYKTNEGTTTQVGSTAVTVTGEGSSLTTKYTATYNYSQSHDSIVKSYTTGGSYIECELPLMLKYYISKDFSVYGGPNVVYGGAPGITEHSSTTTIQRSVNVTTTSSNVPAPQPLSDVLTYNGVPYSQYSPLTPSNGSQLRVGYMLGFSYEYSKKWLFDALLQQGSAQPEVKAGYNISSPLSVPYFRLSVGYKITR